MIYKLIISQRARLILNVMHKLFKMVLDMQLFVSKTAIIFESSDRLSTHNVCFG